MKIIIFISVLLFSSMSFGSIANIYYGPASAGSNDGTSCANAYIYSDATNGFSVSGKWGVGSTQIGQDTIIHMCSGTYTGTLGATLLTFQGSGASGHPITLTFDSGTATDITSPAWGNGSNMDSSGTGAINCLNKNWLVLDGNSNTTIENTANGTLLTNQRNSFGTVMDNCTNVEVRNFIVKNIYVNNGSGAGATDVGGASTTCIEFHNNSTGSSAHGNTVSQCKTGIQFYTDPGGDASGVNVYNNTISDIDWGVNCGGGNATDTINPLNIYNNDISNWTNWQFPVSAFHQDGTICFNVGNPTAGVTLNIHDNYIHGDLGVGSPTGFIYCADFSTCTIYNNVLNNTGHSILGIMWLGQTGNHGKNMTVYNNTIIGLSSDICITLTLSGNAVVKNNVCKGPNVWLHDYQVLATTVTASDFNDVRTAAGAAPQVATSDSTFQTWATWTGTAAHFELNSSNADPLLSGSAPFVLTTGSPSIGLGTNLFGTVTSSAPQSFGASGVCGTQCISRPSSGAFDTGAYQFSAVVPPAPALGMFAELLDLH